jgi:hypothetical protein
MTMRKKQYGKSIIIFITLISHQRAVVKEDNYKQISYVPFSDAAVVKSTVL